MNIGIFIWTLGWTVASHLPETYFLFKNLSSEIWRHFRAMRIFCIDGHYFDFLKILKILKLLFRFTIATTNQKKLFIYYSFLLKVVHTIKLSFSILRELNKFVPRAFCLSNIGWYQRRSYSFVCLIAEIEKQNPLGTKLVVKVKDKRSIIWEN